MRKLCCFVALTLGLVAMALPALALDAAKWYAEEGGGGPGGGPTRSNDCLGDIVWDVGMTDDFTPPTGCSSAASAGCFVGAVNDGDFPVDGRRLADDWIADTRPVTGIKIWARYSASGYMYHQQNPGALHGFCVKLYEPAEDPPNCPDGTIPGDPGPLGVLVYDQYITNFIEHEIPGYLPRNFNYCITLPGTGFTPTHPGHAYYVSASADFDFTTYGGGLTQWFERVCPGMNGPYDPYCEGSWWDTWNSPPTPWNAVSVGINLPCWTGWDVGFVLYSNYVPTLGACCLICGHCELMTQEECAQRQGAFQGPATVCEPLNPCPPDLPPTLAVPCARTGPGVCAGAVLTFQVTAQDPEGRPVALTCQGAPAGATFQVNGGVGTFTWATTKDDAGRKVPVTFRATDVCENVASVTVTLNVSQYITIKAGEIQPNDLTAKHGWPRPQPPAPTTLKCWINPAASADEKRLFQACLNEYSNLSNLCPALTDPVMTGDIRGGESRRELTIDEICALKALFPNGYDFASVPEQNAADIRFGGTVGLPGYGRDTPGLTRLRIREAFRRQEIVECATIMTNDERAGDFFYDPKAVPTNDDGAPPPNDKLDYYSILKHEVGHAMLCKDRPERPRGPLLAGAGRGRVFNDVYRLPEPANSEWQDGDTGTGWNTKMIYFASDRPGGYGGYDLWRVYWDSEADTMGQPENLGPSVNTGANEIHPQLSLDSGKLYFSSDRPGGIGGFDLWGAVRDSVDLELWGNVVNAGPPVNSTWDEFSPRESYGEFVLLFSSNRPGGVGGYDIWASEFLFDQMGQPWNLGTGVNSSYTEYDCYPSWNDSLLIFSSDRPGGRGGLDLWLAVDTAPDDTSWAWGAPANLADLNSEYDELSGFLGLEGDRIYFTSNRPIEGAKAHAPASSFVPPGSRQVGNWDIYVGPRLFQGSTTVPPDRSSGSGGNANLTFNRAWPNPTNQGAWLEGRSRPGVMVRIDIHDAAGRKVRTLAGPAGETGLIRIFWDGNNDGGVRVSSGIYWVRLSAGGESVAGGVLVIR